MSYSSTMKVTVTSPSTKGIVRNAFPFIKALFFVLLQVSCHHNRGKQVIFRNHVLPFLGGKIPESAFYPERLYANLLNKNGIYTTDGSYFQEKHPVRHYFPRTFMPNTLKIQIPRDNKNVAKPGIYLKPETVDTTYLVIEPVEDIIHPTNLNSTDLPIMPDYSLNLMYELEFKKSRIPYDHDSFQIFEEYVPMLRKICSEYEQL